MSEDEDRQSITARRARLITAALSAWVLSACDSDAPKAATSTGTSEVKISARATSTAAPQPCLSFGCPEGYEHVGGPSLLTDRAQQTDPAICAPRSSLPKKSSGSASNSAPKKAP
ncbi:MAG: hypothetical protein U0271_11305 [Polyangiaceae bacterium]